MARTARRPLPGCKGLWLALLAAAASALAGERRAHIGYVYPAGAQQGTVAKVIVGGQYLGGTRKAYITGRGVRAEVTRYTKALSQGVLNNLRDKLAQAAVFQRRRQAALDEGDMELAGKLGLLIAKTVDEFETIAIKAGIPDPTPAGVAALRRRLSDPKRQLNPQIEETVALSVTVAPDAPPGKRELRLRTPSGFTNPLYFHVSQCREYLEKEPNDRRPDSEVLTVKVDDIDFPNLGALPVVINGQIMPGDVDRFRFEIPRGTRLVAAVSARGLIPYLADAVPGWFQATLTLYDPKGNEIAFSDDFRFNPDPVICCEIPQTGEYVLEIRDAIYRGREDFVYRIAVGQLPFVTGVFPLGAPVGAKAAASLQGWNLPVSKLTLDTKGKTPGVVPLRVSRGKHASNPVPFALGTLPECLEAEPNDTPKKAQAVKLPIVVNGRIASPGDHDVFRFEGKEGDEIVAEIHARRLGSPLDSQLMLTDPSGKMLAFNDDWEDKGAGLTTHHADSLLLAKLPADGTYLLHLGDTQHKGGTAYAYRLRISLPRQDFELRVVPSCINVRPGTTVPIAAYALRKDGFAGAIALALKDFPPGFALGGAVIPAGQDSVRLTLTAPPNAPNRTFPLRLEGRATVGGSEVRRMAVPADDMTQAFITHHIVRASDGMVTVVGSRGSTPAIRLLGEGPARLRAGGTATVRFAVPKGLSAKEIRLELDSPPKGISIKETSADGEALAVVFAVAADAKKAKPGLKGNLIFNAIREYTPQATADEPNPPKRTTPLGTIPAVPFEIVPGPPATAQAAKPKAK